MIKHELIHDDLPEGTVNETVTAGTSDTDEKIENNVKTVIKTLFPEKWSNHFGYKVDEVVLLQRVHYCGNWDVLRPARTVEGMDIISEKLLEKLNDEAQYLIEKMRCAV